MPHAVRQLSPLFKINNYKLDIDLLNTHKREFSGKVTITGELPKNSKNIILHSKDLKITKLFVASKPSDFSHESHDELQILGDFKAGLQKITIEFSGMMTDTLEGIYACKYKQDGENKEVIVTQFESHAAREAFPCIDEPAAKATFDLEIITQKNLTVLSNTPVKTQVVSSVGQTTTFEQTPKMSTYLLAFVVGELNFTETTSAGGVKIRAYSTPKFVEQTRFCLEFAAKVLAYYDEYFGVPYPLAKCDMVAVPDFSAGAMENWGLITFRESCLFVNENTATSSKQFNAMVVGHELAHQWFGNLVTMQWWDDLWLNESFANWMGYKVVDHFYPEWRYWEHFNNKEASRAYARDSLATIQSVKQHLDSPEEIVSLFDGAIMYSKGACLVRMLHDYVGDKDFKNGIQDYIKKHAYKNATMKDLWQALDSRSSVNVSAFMEPWVTQPGHPMVSFRQTNGHATLNQRRFFANPKIARSSDESIWQIPLLSDNVEQKILSEKSAQVVLKNEGLNLINKGAGGFYHVNYDYKELADVVGNIRNIQALDRQKLLQDILALTHAGISSTSDSLRLLKAYRNEDQFPVWSAASNLVSSVSFLFEGSPVESKFKDFIKQLVSNQAARLGLSPLKNESYNDTQARPIILDLAVLAGHEQITQNILNAFKKADLPNDLPSEGREVYYRCAGLNLGHAGFEKLLNWYKNTDSAQEKLLLTNGLTSFKDTTIVKKVLELLPTSTVRNQDVCFWILQLMRNEHAKNITWQWCKQNWNWIESAFKGDLHYSDLPQYFAGGFSTEVELKDYKNFFEPKKLDIGLKRNILQGIEDIEVKVLWRKRDQDIAIAFVNDLVN